MVKVFSIQKDRRADASQQRFQELLDVNRNILYKVANTYCRNAEDRQDLVQEISIQVWRAFPRYDTGRSFTTWMYRIALNVAISFVRRNAHRERYSLPLDSQEVEEIAVADTAYTMDDRIALLQQFLEQLDPLNRALLLLYLDEHSHSEIAEILGISETNVATKISRLKQRIRKSSDQSQ